MLLFRKSFTLLHPSLPRSYFRIYQIFHSSLDTEKQKLKNIIIKEVKQILSCF